MLVVFIGNFVRVSYLFRSGWMVGFRIHIGRNSFFGSLHFHCVQPPFWKHSSTKKYIVPFLVLIWLCPCNNWKLWEQSAGDVYYTADRILLWLSAGKFFAMVADIPLEKECRGNTSVILSLEKNSAQMFDESIRCLIAKSTLSKARMSIKKGYPNTKSFKNNWRKIWS